MKAGLVSISFRQLTPEQICQAMVKAGLQYVEWGSDVHAPRNDAAALEQIANLQKQYGITCCSYGTYFVLGKNPVEELPEYFAAAKALGTNILRLWCGSKNPENTTDEEREFLFSQCKQAAILAEKAGVVLCMECHNNTYTESQSGAIELMEYVASPAFRMYWQPNQFRTVDVNISYARNLAPYIHHLHVFQWKGKEKFPLADGKEEWLTYLKQLNGNHYMLLEFMPDNDVASLKTEADTLRDIMGGIV